MFSSYTNTYITARTDTEERSFSTYYPGVRLNHGVRLNQFPILISIGVGVTRQLANIVSLMLVSQNERMAHLCLLRNLWTRLIVALRREIDLTFVGSMDMPGIQIYCWVCIPPLARDESGLHKKFFPYDQFGRKTEHSIYTGSELEVANFCCWSCDLISCT